MTYEQFSESSFAAQHSFRRLLLVPSRDGYMTYEQFSESSFAVQHSFRRLLLVPSRDGYMTYEQLSESSLAAQYILRRFLLVLSRDKYRYDIQGVAEARDSSGGAGLTPFKQLSKYISAFNHEPEYARRKRTIELNTVEC